MCTLFVCTWFVHLPTQVHVNGSSWIFHSDAHHLTYIMTKQCLLHYEKQQGLPYFSACNTEIHGEAWTRGYHDFKKGLTCEPCDA